MFKLFCDNVTSRLSDWLTKPRYDCIEHLQDTFGKWTR
jgi:hypothetical protein